MPLDMVKLCQDYHIPYAPDGVKQCRPGWIQMHCPFCVNGQSGWGLGYALHYEYFNCWKCGWHPLTETLSRLMRISKGEAFRVVMQYKGRPFPKEYKVKGGASHIELPKCSKDLTDKHREYLEQVRKMDADFLWGEYDLYSTLSLPLEYKFRIIIPIKYNGITVSFQTRDITGKAKNKYKICPIDKEVIHHKHTLYGLDQCWDKDSVVVVEGIFDVWRIGPGSVATFGTEWSHPQAVLLSKNFKHIGIMYDQRATREAEKLGETLYSLGCPNVEIITLEHEDSPETPEDQEIDPATITQEAANKFRKDFFKYT